MEPDRPQIDPGFESLRVHRAELLESMRAFGAGFGCTCYGPRQRMGGTGERRPRGAGGGLGEHVELSEGPDGLYQALLATAPHLASSVTGLTDERTQIKDSIDRLLASRAGPVDVVDVDPIRESATTLLGRLSRHRQRGADLVYDAYQTDIGGET